MAIQISPSPATEYTLDASDAVYNEEGTTPSRVTIRKAAQGDFERRTHLFSKWIVSTTTEGVDAFTREFNYQQLKRVEVYLTLSDCNLTGKDKQPLFQFKDGRLKSQASFDAAWDVLPIIIADEIHDKVILANPDWEWIQGE